MHDCKQMQWMIMIKLCSYNDTHLLDIDIKSIHLLIGIIHSNENVVAWLWLVNILFGHDILIFSYPIQESSSFLAFTFEYKINIWYLICYTSYEYERSIILLYVVITLNMCVYVLWEI